MLEEYIQKYEAAQKEGDKKTMARIERALSSIGMDRYTLLTIVAERRKARKQNGEPLSPDTRKKA